MSHLGDRLPAYADGQLPHDVRDRVLAHIAGCPACRAEVAAERFVKARLAAMSNPDVPDDLTRRLLRLAEPGGPVPPRRRPVGTAARPPAVPPASRAGMRPVSPSDFLLRQPRLPYLAIGGISAMALALGAALLAGGPNEPGPALVPAMDRFAVEHALTVDRSSLLDPAGAVQLLSGRVPVQSSASIGAGGGGVTNLYVGRVPPR